MRQATVVRVLQEQAAVVLVPKEHTDLLHLELATRVFHAGRDTVHKPLARLERMHPHVTYVQLATRVPRLMVQAAALLVPKEHTDLLHLEMATRVLHVAQGTALLPVPPLVLQVVR